MQLTLPVHLPIDQQFESFIVGDNVQLVERLRSHAKALAGTEVEIQGPQQVFMHAGLGLGKSHLLYALCHFAETLNIPCFYLSLDKAAELPVALLEGLSQTSLLCIDDVHSLVSNSDWQIALFDLINQRIEHHKGVIVFASDRPPVSAFFQDENCWLPDLVSRLSWGETYAIKPLNHDGQIALLSQRAAQKGLNFSEQAMTFILNHCERNTQSLVNIIERLDKRSMLEKKPLSVNMVKRELEF